MQDDCVLTGCVIGSNCTIGKECTLTNCTVGPRYTVDAETEAKNESYSVQTEE